jgi:hypothetical protein
MNISTTHEAGALRALKSFKRAFVAHYVSLAGSPMCFGELHIPG